MSARLRLRSTSGKSTKTKFVTSVGDDAATLVAVTLLARKAITAVATVAISDDSCIAAQGKRNEVKFLTNLVYSCA